MKMTRGFTFIKAKDKLFWLLLICLTVLTPLFSITVAPPPSYGNAAYDKNISSKGGTIKIAVLIPTEGRFSYFSKQFINGLLLSSHNPNGSKIRYVIVNLPANAGKTNIGYIFDSLAKKGISAVVGPLFAGQLKYFAHNSVKFKIPVITPAPLVTKEDISPFVFGYGMTLKQEIKTDIKYARYAGISPISVIYPDNGYGPTLLAYIRRFSARYGINILNTTAYNAETVDFFYNFNSIVRFQNTEKGHISKAEEAQLGITPYNLMHGITKAKPYIPFKGLFVVGSPSKLELILTQLMYYNIDGFPILGLSSLDSKSFIEKYGFYMQGAIFPNGFFKHDDNDVVKKFDAAYKKYYGEMPNILSAEGYDIGGILIKAAERLSEHRVVKNQYNPLPLGMGQLQNPPTKDVNGIAFYGSILAVKSYKGVCGISRLSGNSFKKGLYLFKYKDNKIYILENPF
ncbi:MAG: penicillin-binding protein activator [Deltaproteobacteria bacterium]|jgi:ABC-type branched-subunit amino acid transport system substrate-binding protein|nr:penicillin-binding protein activator [Deltaproteobacteria bacterium]MCL5879291.1 penicillin-binding protein activator [Deltaproteobacteria bacterium]